MIDRETAQAAISLLSTAIAEIFEDHHALAVRVTGPAAEGAMTKFRVLSSVCADVSTLAAAIDVLARRAEPSE